MNQRLKRFFDLPKNIEPAFFVAKAINAGFARVQTVGKMDDKLDVIKFVHLKLCGFVTKGVTDDVPAEEIPSTVPEILFLIDEVTPFVSKEPQLSEKYLN